MSEKRKYLNKSEQDIHLHVVGGARRERMILEPGATSPAVEISDKDQEYLVRTTGFLEVVGDPDPDPVASPVPVPVGRIDPLPSSTPMETTIKAPTAPSVPPAIKKG